LPLPPSPPRPILTGAEIMLHNPRTHTHTQDAPAQQNGYDCGVFSCICMEYISREEPFDYAQKHMPYLRERMIYEICSSRLMRELQGAACTSAESVGEEAGHALPDGQDLMAGELSDLARDDMDGEAWRPLELGGEIEIEEDVAPAPAPH
jgi:hypothetical protein